METYSHVDSKKVPLDQKIDQLFEGKRHGYFIELGAFDGLFQSNTAFFEKHREWTGILVEPSLNKFNECVVNRPMSNCENYVCVSSSYETNTVIGDFDGYSMSSVGGTRINTPIEKLSLSKATTLDTIIDKYSPANIDFMSLDVEGYELEVLKGMNLRKYRPTYILIEIYTIDYNEVVKFMEENDYQLCCNFTNYNRVDNPGWDGTHNDYLFKTK